MRKSFPTNWHPIDAWRDSEKDDLGLRLQPPDIGYLPGTRYDEYAQFPEEQLADAVAYGNLQKARRLLERGYDIRHLIGFLSASLNPKKDNSYWSALLGESRVTGAWIALHPALEIFDSVPVTMFTDPVSAYERFIARCTNEQEREHFLCAMSGFLLYRDMSGVKNPEAVVSIFEAGAPLWLPAMISDENRYALADILLYTAKLLERISVNDDLRSRLMVLCREHVASVLSAAPTEVAISLLGRSLSKIEGADPEFLADSGIASLFGEKLAGGCRYWFELNNNMNVPTMLAFAAKGAKSDVCSSNLKKMAEYLWHENKDSMGECREFWKSYSFVTSFKIEDRLSNEHHDRVYFLQAIADECPNLAVAAIEGCDKSLLTGLGIDLSKENIGKALTAMGGQGVFANKLAQSKEYFCQYLSIRLAPIEALAAACSTPIRLASIIAHRAGDVPAMLPLLPKAFTAKAMDAIAGMDEP